jgi:plasmid stability protein
MASILILYLDERTKARLRIRAAHNGRSMEDEARTLLRNALEAEPETQARGRRSPLETSPISKDAGCVW